MLRPLGTCSKCIAPSKFHQTHNYAFCENRLWFATGSANCPPRFNHCPCSSRFLIHIRFSSQVTIPRMKWSSRWFFSSFWHVLTLLKGRFFVNSYEASRQRLPMFEKYRGYTIFGLCWWMESLQLRCVWHQNPILMKDHELH